MPVLPFANTHNAQRHTPACVSPRSAVGVTQQRSEGRARAGAAVAACLERLHLLLLSAERQRAVVACSAPMIAQRAPGPTGAFAAQCTCSFERRGARRHVVRCVPPVMLHGICHVAGALAVRCEYVACQAGTRGMLYAA